MPLSRLLCCSLPKVDHDVEAMSPASPGRSPATSNTVASVKASQGSARPRTLATAGASSSGPLPATVEVSCEFNLETVRSPFIRGSIASSGQGSEDAVEPNCLDEFRKPSASVLTHRPVRLSVELANMADCRLPASASDPVAASMPASPEITMRGKARAFQVLKMSIRSRRGVRMAPFPKSTGSRERRRDSVDANSSQELYDHLPAAPSSHNDTIKEANRQPSIPQNADRTLAPPPSAAATTESNNGSSRRRTAAYSLPLPPTGASSGSGTAVVQNLAVTGSATVLPAAALSACVVADVEMLHGASGNGVYYGVDISSVDAAQHGTTSAVSIGGVGAEDLPVTATNVSCTTLHGTTASAVGAAIPNGGSCGSEDCGNGCCCCGGGGGGGASSFIRAMHITRSLSSKSGLATSSAKRNLPGRSSGSCADSSNVRSSAAAANPTAATSAAGEETLGSVFSTLAAVGSVAAAATGTGSGTAGSSQRQEEANVGGGGDGSEMAVVGVAPPQQQQQNGPRASSAVVLPTLYGGNSSVLADMMYGGRSKLPYQASRHMSQVAFLHMYHQPDGSFPLPYIQQGNGANDEDGDNVEDSKVDTRNPSGRPSHSPLLPPLLMATLNLASLSREITGLRWIGQGGGGAVFQGVWQGAPVAVKFLLTDPAAVAGAGGAGVGGGDVGGDGGYLAAHAAAIEGVLSSVVNHPNVVHTYAFECTRLTEASFGAAAAAAEEDVYGRRNSSLLDEEQGAFRDLLETLLEEQQQQQQTAGAAAGLLPSSSGGGGGTNRTNCDTIGQQQQQEQQQGRSANQAQNQTNPDQPNATCNNAPELNLNPTHLNPSANPSRGAAVLESTFQSDEGFGDPDIASCRRGWTVRHVLSYMKARPGMYLTHIIMEYCDRGSLLSAIKRGIFRSDDSAVPGNAGGGGGGGATSSAQAAQQQQQHRFSRRVVLRAVLRTARDVAQGMCHLHANGIIHGDLKPGNVLLRGCRGDRRGFVAMIADFGLSKVTQGDTPLDLPHWSTVTVMAPEVIMGRWSKAADVFSFGMLLWQLVTSEPVPYSKLTVPQILVGVSQGTLSPAWPASAHPALVRLGQACLANNPDKRPSFQAVVKVLTKIEKNVRNELRIPQQPQAQRQQQQQ